MHSIAMNSQKVLHKYTLVWFAIGIAFVTLFAKTKFGLIGGLFIVTMSMYTANRSIARVSEGKTSAGGWGLIVLIFSLFLMMSITGTNNLSWELVFLTGVWFGIMMSICAYMEVQCQSADNPIRGPMNFAARILYTVFLVSIIWFIWDRRYEMGENVGRIFQAVETAALV